MPAHIQASVHINGWQGCKLQLRDLDQRLGRQESWRGAEGKLHRSPVLAVSLSPWQNRWQKQLKGGVYFFFQRLEGPTHHDMGRCSGRTSTLNGGGSLQNICLPLDGQKAESSNQDWGQDLIPRGQHPGTHPSQTGAATSPNSTTRWRPRTHMQDRGVWGGGMFHRG